MMNDAQLTAFRSRMLKASIRGYGVANANLYLVALAKETGDPTTPSGAAKGSAAHLLSMANDALAIRAGTKKRGKGKKAAPKPAPAPEVKTEETEAVWPDDWTKEDLYNLAQKYDIAGRSKMGSDELIAAIEAHEEANPE